ncbi:MAG: TonB-dependent receptor [Calditrichaceae bacterium]
MFNKIIQVNIILSLLIFGLLGATTPNDSAASESLIMGKISGKLVDAESGEPLIGANVYLENTMLGAASDLQGNYLIPSVPAGSYTMVVMTIGYSETKVENLRVKAGNNIKVDLTVQPEIMTSEVVVVEARSVDNTEAALLGKRQKSLAFSDAISAEAISRSVSGDAASAMKMVTGASVVGGKYVYVRGLGERYSSTQLNGAELPSSDPDKKAFQMDILPSNLLDNIVTLKTFTPDQPGNFSGGIVDIGTKSFPEYLTVNFSASSSYNSNATFNNRFLTYDGGSSDWLGFDDGTRAIPGALDHSSVHVPDYGEAISDDTGEAANELDSYSKSFNSLMSPTTKSAPVNQSYALSIGNQTRLFGRELGYLASMSYSNKNDYYDNGRIGKYKLTGSVDTKPTLDNEFDLTESKGVNDVSWGGLMNLAYKINNHHELHSNFLYSKGAESSARYISGFYNEGTIDDAVYETRVLKYTERDLFSSQLRGEHYLPKLLDAKVEWIGSYALSKQYEPDMRFFSDHYRDLPDGTREYKIAPSAYPVPARYYRDLNEDNFSFDIKLSVPFKQWNGQNGKIKAGALASNKTREFRERIFKYENASQLSYDGDPLTYFSESNTGLLYNPDGSIQYNDLGQPVFGNYIVDASEDRSNYDGYENITAGFAMIELPLMNKLRFAGGMRLESTDMEVETLASGFDKGVISETDLLPSVNFIYSLNDKMNLRAAYGRTLARPTIRELAPFQSEDFAAGYIVAGNPDLERALIDNIDLRWEWFERPGEIIAVSGFYKLFSNPIERVIRNDNNEIRYENVDNAILFGAEFEVNKKLDQFHSLLNNFRINANLTLVYSQVDIPESELIRIRASDPYAESTRELQGQSPYILNLNILYDTVDTGTSAGIFYNVFGERLSEVTLGATPNVYEQPRSTLNLMLSQNLTDRLSLNVSAKNLLDSQTRKVQHYKGSDYVYQSYKTGRTFSIGLKYSI